MISGYLGKYLGNVIGRYVGLALAQSTPPLVYSAIMQAKNGQSGSLVARSVLTATIVKRTS